MVCRAAIVSIWLLVVGLIATGLEAHRIRVGHRIYNLIRQREALVERVRRLEVRYNRMVSPDRLQRDLPESFLLDDRLANAE